MKKFVAGLCLFMTIAITAQVVAQQTHKSPIDEARIETLLARMSLTDKVYMLSGATGFGTGDIKELGIHGMRFADGPSGVRSNDANEATAFPVGIAMASSWNPVLAQQVGAAIGEETHAMGSHVLLGPNLNLVRSPLAGRNFETYGEDPFLAGQMGIGFVRGVQSRGVGVSAKHFVGNEQETERGRSSSNIDARALHEIYLLPFEMVVREAQPWTVMTAYNRVNGTYMSENGWLVRDLLKKQWGFDGVVMSDWGGTHSTQAVMQGLDLEMPGPGHHFRDSLLEAVNLYQVPEAAVNDAARRMLRLSARVGALDGALKPSGQVSTPTHRALARTAAAQSITLLKNDRQLLPLNANKAQQIAVIGPNADVAVVGGGGSAQVFPSGIVSPLDAIRALVSKSSHITYEQGADNERFTPAIDGRDLSPTRERKEPGLKARYFANAKFSGKPVQERIEQNVGAMLLASEINDKSDHKLSVQWQGFFWPKVTGDYIFEYEYIRVFDSSALTTPNATAKTKLTLNGHDVLYDGLQPTLDASSTFFPMNMRRATVHLVAGHGYPIAISYASDGYRVNSFRVAVRPPNGNLAAAVAAAHAADVAVLFVGSGTTAESEGRDRISMSLYGEQDALVRAVAQANPHTIVVVNNGGPVAMPWAEQVPAIVEAWLPGQEGAYAISDVLFGRVNPSGKLPISFPKHLEDSPSYLYFPGGRDVNYGESVFMGYRYYDKRQIEPLFPFGHGLSYTQFEYRNLKLPATITMGRDIPLSVEVKNSGERAGAEVVQLYVSQRNCQELCVIRELKDFERVELQPGESRTVNLNLTARSLAHYDPHSDSWQTLPGEFTVAVGSSSRDLRVSGQFTLDALTP